jgi:cytochrome P450
VDPISAVTDPDPYPFYAELATRRPLYRDETLGLWVASSAETVTAVLQGELGRVRPPAEPVPTALLGSPAGEIFGRLIRMNDGAGHCPFNQAVGATLRSLDPARVAREASASAGRLAAELGLPADPRRLSELAFALPVHTLGRLLGVPSAALAQVATAVGEFVRCIAPGGRPEQIERGKVAAGRLLERFGALVAERRAVPADDLLSALVAQAARVGRDGSDVIVANGIGFLTQAYEATAGLISNTLIALARRPELREQVRAEPDLLSQVVHEVLRYDPPVHNTRRFLAAAGVIGGQAMRAGDAVLVVLAAANHDPAANPDPDRFDPARSARRTFTFGAAIHACPGEAVAATIATAGVARLLSAGFDPTALAGPVTYRASANTRVPMWGAVA